MSEKLGPIASAVILPIESELSQSPRSKRRQSSSSEGRGSKRPRISQDGSTGSPNPLRASPVSTQQGTATNHDVDEKRRDPNPERKRISVVEERKRGQRLFGGLLSTLSQSTPNGQQKRRLEIEKRQAEKAQQQKQDDEVQRAEKLVTLKKIRTTEQIKYDEQSMRIRHSNMISMANFLHTRTEPKLYYKPWELLPQEEERIKAQVIESEAAIEREAKEFYRRHPKKPREDTPAEETANDTAKETVGEPRFESPSVSNAPVDTTNHLSAQATQSEQVMADQPSMEEHNGEVVFEAEEDTVIY